MPIYIYVHSFLFLGHRMGTKEELSLLARGSRGQKSPHRRGDP